MKGFRHFKLLSAVVIFSLWSSHVQAQILEWRLVNASYNSTDPDGAGPATGSVTFSLQLHTTAGTVSNVNTISLGWSYQSAKAMIPTSPGCSIVNNPANINASSLFSSAGFVFTTVNQCGDFTQSAGGETFDRRVVGTLDGTSINLTTSWVDVFTVTMWSLANAAPHAGYAIINSGAGGLPGAFPTYAVSDIAAGEYIVNSQTYTTPLPLALPALPISMAKFEGVCTENAPLLTWQTQSDENSDHYEIERSDNGTSGWKYAALVKAAGTSSVLKQYEFKDARTNSTQLYYRLKLVDKDGRFIYSPVVKISCSRSPTLYVYPIPAKSSIHVNLTAEKNGKATFKILDVSGKLYVTVEKDVLKGSNKISLNVSRLSAGGYILRIEENKNVHFKPILIQ